MSGSGDSGRAWRGPRRGGVHERVRHDQLDLDLGQKVDRVLGTAVELGVALLPSEAAHLRHGHPDDAQLRQRLLDVVELERLDDRFDLLHRDLRDGLAACGRSIFLYSVAYSRAEASHEKSSVMAFLTSAPQSSGRSQAAVARRTASTNASAESA